MTQFFAAFGDFFKSIYELFASIIGTFAHAVQAIVSAVLNLFSGVINLFTDVFKGAIDLVGGVGSFLISKSCCAARETDIRLTQPRQHRGHWRSCRRICHLYAPTTGEAYCSQQEDQLSSAWGCWERHGIRGRDEDRQLRLELGHGQQWLGLGGRNNGAF